MIVNNLKDKVYIVFETEDYITSEVYTITPLNLYGCPDETKKITGDIVDNSVEVSLPDGKYLLSVYNTNTEDFEETFTVFYNDLPNIVKDMQNILCPCNNCLEKSKEDVLETFFNLVGFLQKTGLICSGGGFNIAMSKLYNVISAEKDYERYYGEFNLSYTDSVKKVLVYTYIDMYQSITNQITSSENDLQDVNGMLKIDIFEKCLYKLGYNFSDILCEIKKSKCNCNG